MSSEKLNIFDDIRLDEDIIEQKWIAHTPPTRAENFKSSDEVTITVEQRDSLVSIYESFLYVEGQLEVADPTKQCNLVNNAISHLFEEVKLSLNDTMIESIRRPGITSTMRGLAAYNKDTIKSLEIAGWGADPFTLPISIESTDKKFSCLIPLSLWFGIAEDYNKLIVWSKMQLSLVRARTDSNCIQSAESDGNISLSKIEWRVPHFRLSDAAKLRLLNKIDKGKFITIPFRKRTLNIIPGLRSGREDVIELGSVKAFERPHHVIVGFQVNKENIAKENASTFNHANIKNITVYIDSVAHPNRRMNLDFNKNLFTEAYRNYCDFQSSYYGNNPHFPHPLMRYSEFLKSPLYVIDLSKQDESVKAGTVSIKIEIEASTAFANNTYAYVLLLHDTIVSYEPVTSTVTTL